MENKKRDNPGYGLSGRVVDLEIDMGTVKNDIKWIKLMVVPNFLISFVTLLILIARLYG